MTISGIYSNRVPPLPIPNREVKPISADGTAERWESRSMPTFKRLIPLGVRRFFYAIKSGVKFLFCALFEMNSMVY